ncbi:unnamed protein product [Ascophyllum nodosum]
MPKGHLFEDLPSHLLRAFLERRFLTLALSYPPSLPSPPTSAENSWHGAASNNDPATPFKSGEFVLASIIMRLIRHGDVPISEAVKTFRFLAELIFIAGVLASSIGATAGAYIMTSEFPGSVYNDQWTDWFIGDLTGNFIVLYIGCHSLDIHHADRHAGRDPGAASSPGVKDQDRQ